MSSFTSSADVVGAQQAVADAEALVEQVQAKAGEVDSDKTDVAIMHDKVKDWRDDAQRAAAEATSAVGRVISGGLYFAGDWDASTGQAPPEPESGEGNPWYKVTGAGVISGATYEAGDGIMWVNSGWLHIDNTENAIHGMDEITGLMDALAGKSDKDHGHDWNELSGKPSEFNPAEHSHPWNQITGKPSEFNPTVHGHNWDQISGKPVTATRWPNASEVGALPASAQWVGWNKRDANDYPGLQAVGGGSPSYIRSPPAGLLPYDTGKTSYNGTAGWPWYQIHGVTIYENGVSLSVKYLTKNGKAVAASNADKLAGYTYSQVVAAARAGMMANVSMATLAGWLEADLVRLGFKKDDGIPNPNL